MGHEHKSIENLTALLPRNYATAFIWSWIVIVVDIGTQTFQFANNSFWGENDNNSLCKSRLRSTRLRTTTEEYGRVTGFDMNSDF